MIFMRKKKKGISTFIAVSILLVLTIGISFLVLTFLANLTETSTIKINQNGEKSVSCGGAQLFIDKDEIDITNSLNVTVENIGQTDLTNLKIVAYNETGAYTYNTTPSSIQRGTKVTITSDGVPQGTVTKIKVYSEDCPGVEAVVEKNGNEWETTDD